MKKWIAAIAAGVLVAGSAACGDSSTPEKVTVTESASPTTESSSQLDRAFLAQFKMIGGMDDLTTAQAVSLAHSTCTAMEVGNKTKILSILQDKYGTTAAVEFMHLSASVYCQDQLAP